MTLCYPSAFAIGFGEATLRSNIGDVLRVQVPLSNATDDVLVPSCFRATVSGLDGEIIDLPRIEFILPSPNRPTVLSLVTRKQISEPAVKLSVAMICGASVQREYNLLLDYPDYPAAVPMPVETAQVPQSVPAQVDQPRQAPVRKPVAAPAQSAAEANPGSSQRHVASTSSEAPHRTSRKSKFTEVMNDVKPAKSRDVLHVESNDVPADPDLKLSQTLSDSGTATGGATSGVDLQRQEENRRAQEQFAAILRGDDPAQIARSALKKEQDKNRNLQNELTRLKQQGLDNDQHNKNTSSLMTGLIAGITVLVIALAALVVFALRRGRKSTDSTWWDTPNEQKKNVVDIVDYLQSSAEEGNLDPATIIPNQDQQPAGAPDSQVKTESPAVAMNQEEPAPKFKRMGLPALEDTNSSTFNFFGNRTQSIQIEEISDITQEAEFWMSVNDPQRAIEILEPQSLDENPKTPITWLYLLDLYRLVGDETNYRDLRQRFKTKFNARIPEFQEEPVTGEARSFEEFPHLISNVCTLWKTDDIMPYLESLLVDDREGERIGFDLPVYREILFLLTICAELKRPQYHAMAKNDSKPASKSTEVLQPLEDHLIVKPQAKLGDDAAKPEQSDYGNTLNFDLLDFKTDIKTDNKDQDKS